MDLQFATAYLPEMAAKLATARNVRTLKPPGQFDLTRIADPDGRFRFESPVAEPFFTNFQPKDGKNE